MTRREFLVGAGAGYGALRALQWVPLGLEPAGRKALKFAVISDLHHGLAPDAQSRLQAFCDEVRKRKDIQLVIQLGDFNYSQPESAECVKLFNELTQPKVHVLGNHDMDKCDKDAALKFWGMKSRYGAEDHGDYRFLVLDLNHFKKEGKLVSYAGGNYFTDNATHNWADPDQLAWLDRELRTSKKPVVLLSHQPLGFAEPGQSLPPEQVEIVDIVTKAKVANPGGAVAISLFGHLHVDRLERVGDVPYYCVNSASYFWGGGMYPYSKPLFAFMELTSDGSLKVEGVQGAFVKPPPAGSDGVVGRSASIEDRRIGV